MRRIENRIEVPGTPEEVWELIATGHGIEAWFVPAEVESRVGGRVAIDIGTGMEECGTVSAWEPPHRFAYDEEGLASEFLVEAQSGGTCVVRIVSTIHADGDDWDRLLEDLRSGWDGYLLILRLYCDALRRPARARPSSRARLGRPGPAGVRRPRPAPGDRARHGP